MTLNPTLIHLKSELQQLADPKQREISQRFFKTGPGEYGEGDIFLGIKVPLLRKVAKRYKTLSLKDIQSLLQSPIHEYRFIALILLIHQYPYQQQKVFDFYINNRQQVNNWDLVDISAPHIVGNYLLDKPKEILYQWVQSHRLWDKRIAIVATLTFIKHHQFDDTLQLATQLLSDQHDLIHKAVGWMLREIGKRNQAVEEEFLKQHVQQMPRTMLRYAIEKFDDKTRQFYLKGGKV